MFNTSSLQIEQAQPLDAGTIASIHAQSWRSNYRGALSDSFLDGDVVRNRLDLWQKRLNAPTDDQVVLVARQTPGAQPADTGLANVIGFACGYFRDNQQWGTLLDNLHVLPSAQRQGIGAALLGAVAGWSRSRDPRVGLYLWVLDQNQKARQFYERFHAQDVGGDVWDPPGGGSAPRRRYVWRDLERLCTATQSDGLFTRVRG